MNLDFGAYPNRTLMSAKSANPLTSVGGVYFGSPSCASGIISSTATADEYPAAKQRNWTISG